MVGLEGFLGERTGSPAPGRPIPARVMARDPRICALYRSVALGLTPARDRHDRVFLLQLGHTDDRDC